MEYSITMLIVIAVALVCLAILLLIIFNLSGESQGLVKWLVDYIQGLTNIRFS